MNPVRKIVEADRSKESIKNLEQDAPATLFTKFRAQK